MHTTWKSDSKWVFQYVHKGITLHSFATWVSSILHKFLWNEHNLLYTLQVFYKAVFQAVYPKTELSWTRKVKVAKCDDWAQDG